MGGGWKWQGKASSELKFYGKKIWKIVKPRKLAELFQNCSFYTCYQIIWMKTNFEILEFPALQIRNFHTFLHCPEEGCRSITLPEKGKKDDGNGSASLAGERELMWPSGPPSTYLQSASAR
ncbi:unnamed protein product [Caretta caretta]